MSKRKNSPHRQNVPEKNAPTKNQPAQPAFAREEKAKDEKTKFDWILPSLIAAYILLTGLLIFSVPIGATPDENAHLDYVEYIATKAQLPFFQATGSSGYGYEFHQPPLYYLICAPLSKIAAAVGGKAAAAYACRLVSLACGAWTLLLLWHSIAYLFRESPERRALQILAVGFCALWPMHQGVGASAGNDALAGLLAAMLFFLVAKREGFQKISSASFLRWAALLGLCLGLGILTKTTVAILSVVAVGAIISLWLSANKQERGTLIRPLAIFGLAAVAVCGWWLLRNQLLYGDPLAAQEFQRAFNQSSRGPNWFLERGMPVPIYLQMVALFLFCSAWGILGGPNTAQVDLSRAMVIGIPAGREDVLIAIVFLLLCALACAISLFGWKSRNLVAALSVTGRQSVLLWLLGFILATFAWAIFNLSFFQVQARYFHPALLPMCLFFALGWRQALGNGRVMRVMSIGFGVILLLITLWNVFLWKTLV